MRAFHWPDLLVHKATVGNQVSSEGSCSRTVHAGNRNEGEALEASLSLPRPPPPSLARQLRQRRQRRERNLNAFPYLLEPCSCHGGVEGNDGDASLPELPCFSSTIWGGMGGEGKAGTKTDYGLLIK